VLRPDSERPQPHWIWPTLVAALLGGAFGFAIAWYFFQKQAGLTKADYVQSVVQQHISENDRDLVRAKMLLAHIRLNRRTVRANLDQILKETKLYPNIAAMPPLQFVEELGTRDPLPDLVIRDTTLSRLAIEIVSTERALNSAVSGRNQFKLSVTTGPPVVEWGHKFSDPTPNDQALWALTNRLTPQLRSLASLGDSFITVFDVRHFGVKPVDSRP
jgi:hypothetical protein